MKGSVLVVIALAATITAASAAMRMDKPVPHYKNLKVLPKNITQKQLSEIMVDEFQDDLGVSCNFCHTENKQTHQPDYVSDDKPEKQIAREMMRMTNRINEKYFQVRHAGIGDSTSVVTCGTCHQGKPQP